MGITWVVPGHHKGHSELRKELGAVAMKGPGKHTAAGSGDEERSPPIRTRATSRSWRKRGSRPCPEPLGGQSPADTDFSPATCGWGF